MAEHNLKICVHNPETDHLLEHHLKNGYHIVMAFPIKNDDDTIYGIDFFLKKSPYLDIDEQ